MAFGMAVEVCGVFLEMRYEQTLTKPKRWNKKMGMAFAKCAGTTVEFLCSFDFPHGTPGF